MPPTASPIAIFLNKDRPALSESFIQNHIDHLLPATLINYYRFLGNLPKSEGSLLVNWIKSGAGTLNDWRLGRLLRRKRIKVVLAEYGMVGADCYRLCRSLDLPLVIHFHGQDAHRRTTVEPYAARYREAFQYASAIVVVSSYMREQLLALGAPPEKVHLNIYGVDTELFTPAPVEVSPPVLFAAGRFVDKKAPESTILAFRRALDQVPEARLVMAGDGELFPTCRRLVAALDLQDHVSLLGAVPHTEIAATLQSCRAFVQHSRVAYDGDAEGTPNTILEAGASAVPVVSTRHAGIRDVVIEGETGLLVEEGDVAGMSEQMVLLLSDADYAARLGRQARVHIQENYSLEESIGKLRGILASAKV